MSQEVVDEFYLQHETVRHILDDLRQLPVCKPEEQKPINFTRSDLAIDLAEALTGLREVMKNPNATILDIEEASH